MKKIITIIGSFFLPATPAFAAAEAVSASEVGKLFGGLIAVVAVIFWGAWLARKFSIGSSFSNNENLKIISMLSLGTREKILLLEVGDEQIVIGTSAQGIQHLHTLNQPIIVATELKKSSSFSQHLKRLINKTQPNQSANPQKPNPDDED